jgi:hypothetical protein
MFRSASSTLNTYITVDQAFSIKCQYEAPTLYAVAKEKLFHEFFFRAGEILFGQVKFKEVHARWTCIEFKFS